MGKEAEKPAWLSNVGVRGSCSTKATHTAPTTMRRAQSRSSAEPQLLAIQGAGFITLNRTQSGSVMRNALAVCSSRALIPVPIGCVTKTSRGQTARRITTSALCINSESVSSSESAWQHCRRVRW